MYKVKFLPVNRTVAVPPGTTVLEAEIAAGLKPDAPCGGMGACGKCTVEIRLETGGSVLARACKTAVDRDIEVILTGENESHRILTEGAGELPNLSPPVKTAVLHVEKATLSSPASDWRRLSDAAERAFQMKMKPDPLLANELGKTLERLSYEPEAVAFGDELLALRKEGRLLTAAVDIGTTTVVLYLADGKTGQVLSVNSALNPQTEFGADVISRANYAMQHSVEKLSSAIRGAVNDLLAEALSSAKADFNDVFSLVAVGNTCMHHLFLGMDPSGLVLSPYVPSVDSALFLNAADYGIRIHPRGKLILLPCIAGFVGADTASVMVACDFDRRDELTLAIDIGTNGELVLGDRNRTVACSTAAGPAFEGAKIQCGMRGAEGAIDHAAFENGNLSLSVIGGGAPRGICGSGLLDITAALLKAGILDETGRFTDGNEVPESAASFAKRLQVIAGQKCFVLAEAGESASGSCVYLSQKDIREVQLAKGAMAAGIGLLLEHLGERAEDVKHVLIAGAFGNYMSPESACAIGLIPSVLLPRIEAVGNAAGSGALLCALSQPCLKRAIEMAEKTEFIELAANPNFQDRFVDELMFPENES